jgi:hypothetical protein
LHRRNLGFLTIEAFPQEFHVIVEFRLLNLRHVDLHVVVLAIDLHVDLLGELGLRFVI